MYSFSCIKLAFLIIINLFLYNILFISCEKIIFPSYLDAEVKTTKGNHQHKSVPLSHHMHHLNGNKKHRPIKEEIPIEVYKKLSKIQNLKQLHEQFNITDGRNKDHTNYGKFIFVKNASRKPVLFGANGEDDFILADRSGGYIVESTNAIKPKPAYCKPELTVIPINKSTDTTTTVLFPSCIRIERCSGCCVSDALSCQPVETKTVNYEIKIYKLEFNANAKALDFKFVETKIVGIEKHTKCECDCNVKQSDCNPLQIYRGENCACECKNKIEMEQCLNQEISDSYWDTFTCSCRCKNEVECSSGSFFSNKSCTCEPDYSTRSLRNF
ncbi:uncharacterized protein LOC142332402 [Lycorma delicatula]|uniref:uncharacterized protein LOC142332402 n=1 Tax=Lycorma delicatula TaxID=130591 RepID=UPI003F510E18